MGESTVLCLLALHVSLRSVTCIFFHEPSPLVLQPAGGLNGSDFGYAMGYWRGSLIVGSPSSSFFGEVYSCPVSSFAEDCTYVELNATSSNYSLEKNPKQKFYLGASIATTKDYFFTCAPLVTKTIRRRRALKQNKDAYGSCFVFTKNGTSFRVKGPDDRFISGTGRSLGLMEGGTGWNTLADEVNGFLITAKTSVDVDINYYKHVNSIFPPTSLISNKANKKRLFNMMNVGYGLVAGKFFSNKTVYAVSMQSTMMTGEIGFLQPVKSNQALILMDKNYTITSRAVNGMFGYTLAAADLNLDGLSDLLVGSPTESDDADEVEYGALHIYFGGDIEKWNDKSNVYTIFGIAEQGRFGTAVAANDVDGDKLPEIFVSAPYEDNDGVVYILSGYDLKKTLLSSIIKQMSLTQLNHKQRIHQAGMSLLGFSLQVVPDVDGNECDELAIGAPGADVVLLYKCLQTVSVNVTSQIFGSPILKEQDNEATIHVCVHIGYRSKMANISGYISVTNDIKGGSGAILSITDKTVIDLSSRIEVNCNDVNITFKQQEMADYTFKTQLEFIDIDKTLKSKDFDPTWAVLSPYSEMTKELTIIRRCSDDDCNPLLSFEIKWTGSQNESEPYKLGSSKNETLSIVVRNDGHEAYGACVWVTVQGATMSKVVGKEKDGGYECPLPSPLMRNAEHSVNITLNMIQLSNTDTSLFVTAKLPEHCNGIAKTKEFKSPYSLEKEKGLVYLNGKATDFEITDIEISDDNIDSFRYEHEYLITNNASITWRDVQAVVTVPKQKIIETVGTNGEEACTVQQEAEQYTVNCILTVLYGQAKTIIVSVELLKEEVAPVSCPSKKNIIMVSVGQDTLHFDILIHEKVDPGVISPKLFYPPSAQFNPEQQIKGGSEMKLYLKPTKEVLKESVETVITWKKDKRFGNHSNVIIIIAIILAILFLALIIFILYKNGFFKRKEKKRLDVLRDSVRRRSIRLASESKQSQKMSSAECEDDGHIEMEVVDCVFEEVPASTNDDVVLIEAKADIHDQQ